MRLFFKHGISKLGNGEFRDAIERIQKRFETELMRSEIQDIQNSNSF